MQELRCDFWTTPADAKCIPTNGIVKSDGTAVMGAGVAKQAAEMWPLLPSLLAKKLKLHGNLPFEFRPETLCAPHWVFTFPTKHDWRDKADLALIETSATYLVDAVTRLRLQTVLLPRPGCGAGHLPWPVVQAVLAKHLDSRFIITHL